MNIQSFKATVGEPTSQHEIKMLYEQRPSEVMASWQWKKLIKLSTLILALQKTDFWDPTFFHHIWLGVFTMISYERSFQRCCKTWICSLGFSYGSCMIMFHHVFFLQSGNSWMCC